MPKRSGFLNQLINGKPDFALQAADPFDNFFDRAILMSDSSYDSHRVFQKMDATVVMDTPSHRMNFAPANPSAGAPQNQNNNLKAKLRLRKTAIWGNTVTRVYMTPENPDKTRLSYKFFTNVRKLIFRALKLIDFAIRSPAMIFAGLQIAFEGIGWKIQTLYQKIDNPFGKAAAFILLGPIGFALNFVGAVPMRGLVFVSKVAAEAIRAPLAVAGAGVGLVFGIITAVATGVAKLAGVSDSFRPAKDIMILAVLDGIRPFAPEFANFLNINYMTIQAKGISSLSVRLPFTELPAVKQGEGNVQRANTVDVPWLPLAMFVVAVLVVAMFSISTMGIGALGGVPLLPFLFNATGLGAAGFGFTAPVFMAAAIGGLTAAGVGISRGITAFANDTVSIVKSAYTGITNAWKNYKEAKEIERDLVSGTTKNKEKNIEMNVLTSGVKSHLRPSGFDDGAGVGPSHVGATVIHSNSVEDLKKSYINQVDQRISGAGNNNNNNNNNNNRNRR